jgi:hypothetical protein
MLGACAASGEMKCAHRILVVKPEGKRMCGNIITELRKIGWNGVDWIDLA